MKRAAIFLPLLLAALVFPAVWGDAGEMQDGAPPRLLEWPMLPGESLAQLSRLIYPGDIAMQRRFVTAAVRENPATFSQINAGQKFEQETLIWLPDLKELSQLASSARSPRHYLRPVLPAMQPSVAGAQPSRLQMSTAIDSPSSSQVERQSAAASSLSLTPSPAIRHMNVAPIYDSEAASAIAILVARNEALKKEQETLDARIAALEAGIAEVRDAIARDRRRTPRRIKRAPEPTHDNALKATSQEESLLSPSPLHLMTGAAILLVGSGIIMWRRRQRQAKNVTEPVVVAVAPAALQKQASETRSQAVDFGMPETAIQIEENFADDFISVDEIESIVEEAKVFVALGRGDHAIEVLEDYVTTHPRASVHPWLYLLEVYRSVRRRDAFEATAKRFHQALNVMAPSWEAPSQLMMVLPQSLDEFPHILARLVDGWGTRDAHEYLDHLLQDNRGGERQGFSMEVLQEILLLVAILETRDHMPPLEPF